MSLEVIGLTELFGALVGVVTSISVEDFNSSVTVGLVSDIDVDEAFSDAPDVVGSWVDCEDEVSGGVISEVEGVVGA